ncbi:helix-turn-helix transcriptional regulator [Enterocloster clostridioformis]|uniref:helix-turn-helix domain-containing protein n=1 Tax=Enterocloster clostridioformis TaxID=1531 RepID=UPI002675D1FD|nr:helix-turn-helix transcriptional regulator [Enterocloster clostridioformis]
MPISYEKLFKLLEEKNITTYYLRQNKIIGQQTYYNLKNGKGNLGTESLEKLCKLLSCQPGDLMEYISEQPHPKEGV